MDKQGGKLKKILIFYIHIVIARLCQHECRMRYYFECQSYCNGHEESIALWYFN